jgi:glutaredoxin 3
MTDITIYTRPMCGYCARAVSLLKQKGVAFTEIDAGFDQAKRQEMIQRSNGGRTFPQIFGCDDLMALERGNKLDALLQA